MNFLWAPIAALGVYYAFLSLERALRRRLLQTQTCVLDVDSLGHRAPRQKIKGTAVICGGSIAGLTAARVCHDHFEDVIIIEPEAWLNSADAKRPHSWNQQNKRSRIMQYESFHALMTIGYTTMKKLFPDFVEECKSSAIRTGPNDTHVHLWGHDPKKPYDEYGGTLPKTIYAGRIGLETLLRRLVLGGNYENIRQVTGTATGVSRNASNADSIDRVSVRTVDGNIVNIPAALVIDCTGSTTAGLRWLQREGYGFADTYAKNQLPLDGLKIAYDQKLRYSTLQFRVPPELGRKLPGLPVPYDECGVIYCLLADPEKENRGVYSQRIDGDFMQICFGIVGGDGAELPKNLEEGKGWCRSLITEVPIPEGWFAMLDMLEEVEDSMTCSQVRFAPSTWIRYEKAVNLPSNWIAAGDSVMRVNPLHGHGCSKAMYGAICLDRLLQDVQSSIPEDFSQRYFRMHAAKIEPLWDTTKVADYAYPSTVPVPGETLSQGSWLRWYMKRLMILSLTDAQAGSAIWHFRVLLAPSIDLLQSRLLLKALWDVIKHPLA